VLSSKGGLPLRIDVVEPTLEGDAGHCRSFLLSLCGAGPGREATFRVYGGRGASLPSAEGERCEVIPYFHRRLRRLQAFFLYRTLLEGDGRIFVSTAGRTDMVLLDLAAKREIPPGKVFLFFHWLRPSPRKLSRFRRFALSHPGVTVLGPTEAVIGPFRECGFRDVRVVPYPITPVPFASGGPAGRFRHVLFAGAARQDKGFGRIVDLIAHLSTLRLDLPVTIQTSPDHYDRFEPRTRADLERLREIRYPSLRVCPETLDTEAYAELFRGGICLQPYLRDDFADRVSGVMLDAFSAGCPVIATEGTWMARAVHRFDAGIPVEDLSPESLLSAVRTVIGRYGQYGENAAAAGRTLQEENSARHLYTLLSAN
jgi:glycosyltransferase involved in cell wall biosynthesis